MPKVYYWLSLYNYVANCAWAVNCSKEGLTQSSFNNTIVLYNPKFPEQLNDKKGGKRENDLRYCLISKIDE